MNWLLIVVSAILIVNALIGYKMGFIKSIFSLISFVLALILTIWISPTVNKSLAENEKFHQMISEKTELMLSIDDKEAEASDQEELINDLPLPNSIKDTLIENKEKGENNLKEYIVDYVTGVIINAISFVLTFLVVFILLWVISFALNIISKLPLIHQMNKLAGLFMGAIQGFIIVWLLFILLTVFGGTQIGQDAFQMIQDSRILDYIYNNNLLLRIVTNAVSLLLSLLL